MFSGLAEGSRIKPTHRTMPDTPPSGDLADPLRRAQHAEGSSRHHIGDKNMQRGMINHLDLTVADLEVSCAFYGKVLGRLGYTRTLEYEGSAPCWVLAGPNFAVSIGLHKAKVATPHDRFSVGLHHLAFHLTSRAEIDGFHEFLVHEQITVLDAPAEYDYTPGYYAVFFADPDGMKLELVHEPRLDEIAG